MQEISRKNGQCTSEECKASILASFRNLPTPKAFYAILNVLKTAPRKLALAALKSLQKFPSSLLKKEKSTFLTIFSDSSKDSSLRTTSADIILKLKPSKPVFEQFLKVLQTEESNEFVAYCLNRMFEIQSRDLTIHQLIR